MQDLSCDDCSLMNNENSASVNTIKPCSLTPSNVAYRSLTVVDNNSPEQSSSDHCNSNNYNGSLLRDIKLEVAQDNSTFPEEYFNSSTQCTFGRMNTRSGSRPITTTTATSQIQQNQSHLDEHIQSSHTNNYNQSHSHHHSHRHHHHHQQHQQQHQHHHHQLLLHGSDDPLISHGADSVINDDDYCTEYTNLLTAATNGQKKHHQQQQQQQIHQHQNQNQRNQETDHHHTHQNQEQKKPQQQLNGQQNVTQQNRLSLTASGLIQKRPPNGCSSLTKQQLKVKAGLMSAAQKQQQKQIPYHATPNVSTRTNPTNKTKPKAKKAKILNSVNTASGNGSGAGAGTGTVKLRFHHQALPPEYLSHYEATQRQHNQSITTAQSQSSCNKTGNSTAVKVAQTAKLPPPKSSHENVRSWLQKIAEIQRTAQLQQQNQHQDHQEQQEQPSQQSIKQEAHNITASGEIAIQRILTAPQHDANNNHQTCPISDSQTSAAVPFNYERVTDKALRPHIQSTLAATRKINYADLPYMGEITLNNSKPRRGRKPKKADICHLIYKNYGTILTDVSKTVLGRPQTEQLPTFQLESQKQVAMEYSEEPLNLCLRDCKSSDLLSVSSGEGNFETGEEGGFNDEISDSGETNSNCTIPGDALTDSMLATNMKAALPCLEEANENKPMKIEHTDEPTNPHQLLRPVRAYYQKLLECGMLLKQNDDGSTSKISSFAGLPIETIEKDNQIALKIPIPSGFFLTSKMDPKNSNHPHPVPLDYPEPLSTPSSIKSEQSFTTTTTSSNVTGSNGNGNGITTIQSNATTPQKRKRSAIFIPPMPSENALNPANEVSICKFKFTGGVKPTLQEKKMLSVDSDGNYRYYSGTGDKSMRGYEFFPRESLQQSGFLPGVGGAGAFLNATGEKISADIPPPSADLSNELLQIPDSPNGPLLLDGSAVAVAAVAQNSQPPVTTMALCSSRDDQSNSNQGLKRNTIGLSYENGGGGGGAGGAYVDDVQLNAIHRKKKSQSSFSRRTTQREKLERTFKEKGFLIQTQQLESAEGATYCKFRQLKKFTRYLFRNWKDYLPDGQVLKSQDYMDVANQHTTIEGLLSDHSFDTSDRDTVMEHNTQHEASTEVISTDALSVIERV